MKFISFLTYLVKIIFFLITSIPLIQDLRNKALRPRHWASLQERVGAEFNPQSPTFTLNEVVKLGLNTHAEFIGEMSANANKVFFIMRFWYTVLPP